MSRRPNPNLAACGPGAKHERSSRAEPVWKGLRDWPQIAVNHIGQLIAARNRARCTQYPTDWRCCVSLAPSAASSTSVRVELNAGGCPTPIALAAGPYTRARRAAARTQPMIRNETCWLALGASDRRGGIDKLLARVVHGFALGAQTHTA